MLNRATHVEAIPRFATPSRVSIDNIHVKNLYGCNIRVRMAIQQRTDEQSDDEEYNENEDEDFNPDAAGGDDDISSSSDDDDDDDKPATKKAQKTKKRKARDELPDAELDSGDEATIKERKRKRRKGKSGEDAPAIDEDSGGEGGLIKTRRQRLAEKEERRERRRTGKGEAVTVDVEKLWEDLSRIPIGRASLPEPGRDDGGEKGKGKGVDGDIVKPTDELIKIKRRIHFAGQITEVEEEVLKSSAEAQRYLAEHPEADPAFREQQASTTAEASSSTSNILRPLRRPSMFEPNPTAIVRGVPTEKLRPRAPSRLDVLLAEKRAAEEQKKRAEKMSTVQKSALDWKGFVTEEGIGEELREYGKSKKGFLAREQFLDSVAGRGEEARRDARMKG